MSKDDALILPTTEEKFYIAKGYEVWLSSPSLAEHQHVDYSLLSGRSRNHHSLHV